MKNTMLNKIKTISYRWQLVTLITLDFGLNFNTLFNKYAVDDVVVLTENSVVMQGVKGIPKLLTTEFYFGREKNENDVSGGRYRPFALIIFALEYQFFGANPMISHLINVLLFVFLVALLFKLFHQYIFRDKHKYLAFLTCLLFVVHPIHTEVIANVKSRDEIIAFVLLLLSAYTLIRYSEKKSIVMIISGLLCFLCALLTRESAIPFIVVVPLVAYFFFNQPIKKITLLSIPLVLVVILYMGIRFAIIGSNSGSNGGILNDPFLYASASEAFATKIYALYQYISLLIFPFPLSSDYGYNQIAYIPLFSLPFILSASLLVVLGIIAIYQFKRKTLVSFSIFYFFLTIFLFSNLIIEFGVPLAERLLFQPSLAFCILFAMLFIKAQKHYRVISYAVFLLVVLLFSVKTVLRNAEWKDNFTLYSKDVQSAPNSLRNNLYAANQYLLLAEKEESQTIKNEYYQKAVTYDLKALEILPHYILIYQDLGLAYFKLNDYTHAAEHWLRARNIEPENETNQKRTEMLSGIFYNLGEESFKSNKTKEAIEQLNKAVELNERHAPAWHLLAKCYLLINDEANARLAMQNAFIAEK